MSIRELQNSWFRLGVLSATTVLFNFSIPSAIALSLKKFCMVDFLVVRLPSVHKIDGTW